MLDRIVVKKVIGIKQCTKLLKSGEGKVLYVAKDANAKLISPIIQLTILYYHIKVPFSSIILKIS